MLGSTYFESDFYKLNIHLFLSSKLTVFLVYIEVTFEVDWTLFLQTEWLALCLYEVDCLV